MSKSRSKSRPKSQAKSRNQRPAAKTVKELKSLFHFCWEFFLLLPSLWKLGRKLFGENFGLSGKKKEPSLSLERPDATSSSAAVATASGASGAAEPANEKPSEEPASEILSPGTEDPCHDPNPTGNSNEALPVGPEDIEGVISSTRHTVGGVDCTDRAGYDRKGEAQVNTFGRVQEMKSEDDKIKSERPRSDSANWKEMYEIEKEKYTTEKKIFPYNVELRQVLTRYEKSPAGQKANAGLKKEVLKLPEAKNEKFGMILAHTSYTTTLRMMHFQKANMAVKPEDFGRSGWRKDNRFPTFSNDSAKYEWWWQNYHPEILKKRLKILRVASDKYDQHLDMYMIITIVSEFNSELHPPPRENEKNETDEDKLCRLVTVIRGLRSSGNLISQMKI